MKRFADFIIEKRLPILIGIILVTLFFLYQVVTNLTVKTIFPDLLPKNHAYINLYNEIRNKFGGANQVIIMVQVRDKEDGGKYDDIFNYETLNIVKSIDRDLLAFHAVDRYKIFSVANRKNKNFVLTASGYTLDYLMFPDVPKTEEGLNKLRGTVYGLPWNYPALISLDSKSAIIMVDFFEEQINYSICFKELRALRKKYENENHIIAISGEPMHLGYIDYYVGDVLKVLAYTVITMMVMFLIYFRSKRGMILPMFAAGVSAIWGFGFLALMDYNLDPLVLVFPFIIATRAASHSVQIIRRYMEAVADTGNIKESCKFVIEHMFVPGFAGIVTDASGIIVIALTPIPILQKICLSCGFWAFATTVHAMILVPILLSYMPIRAFKKTTGLLDSILKNTGRWIVSWGKYPVLIGCVAFLIWGTFFLGELTIGNAVPGSEVFWPWHRYNVDSFRITFANPQLNPLYVIIQGYEDGACANPTVLRDVNRFIKYMKDTPDMRVMMVMAVMGQIPGRNRVIRSNDPNWLFLPKVDELLMALWRNVIFQSAPGSYDKYVDEDEMAMNIVILCRDKTSETIRLVIDRVNDFIRNESLFGKRLSDVERHGFDKFIYWVDDFFREKPPPIPEKPRIEGVPEIHYRLAGGAVGVQAGINEALTVYQFWTFLLALTTVFIFCSFSFRSVVAGIIVTVPLILSNLIAFAVMVLNNPPLPLTTATLPVSAIGIGLGVDYGIYLVSRIIEEHKNTGTIEGAITTALSTTGKGIIFVATTLVCGIGFWFISKLMFQALMGLLLAVILIFNMFGALLIIPSIIALIKPKFVVGKK